MRTLVKIYIAILVITCSVSSYRLHAQMNAVDSIQTDSSAISFVTQQNDSLFFSKQFHTDFKITPLYLKADLDNNGLTDLIVNNESLLLVMAFKEGYKLQKVGNYYNYLAKKIIHSEDQALVVTEKVDNDVLFLNKNLETDTLVYQLGTLIELNSKPTAIALEELDYYKNTGRKTMHILIKNKKELHWYGKFCIIDDSTYKSMTSLLNYIDIDSLKPEYNVPVMDYHTAVMMRLKYNNGKRCYVYDYGLSGTLGLSCFYKILNELIADL